MTSRELYRHSPSHEAIAHDPVCGMSVVVADAKYKNEYGGSTFHFCSAGCLAKFKADSEHLNPAAEGIV